MGLIGKIAAMLTLLAFTYQKQEYNYFLVDKGVMVNLTQGTKGRLVKFKDNYDFYFEYKNDSVAKISDIINHVRKAPKEYQISSTYDTSNVKVYSIGNDGASKVEIEKVIYRKVVPRSFGQ